MGPTRPLLRVLTPLLAAGLILTACGGSDEPEEEPEAESTPAAVEPATWPLTGLPVPDGESVEKTHPVYVVKVDNTVDSDPQIGLGDAELVTEELVEGGITRLAVFFYAELPKQTGPVRSMRASDVGIASPVDATIVTSGAAGYTKEQLTEAGVTWIEMGNPNVRRVEDGTHDSLHSVMADLAAIGKSADQDEARPDDYFTWGGDSDFPGGKKATTVTASFGNHASVWRFAGGQYTLTDGFMEEQSQFHPSTVVVAKVRTSIAPYTDPAGNPVPTSHFVGKGSATIFHGGQAVRATWVKKTEKSPVTFTRKDGSELPIPAGKVWLELVPKDGGSVTFTK